MHQPSPMSFKYFSTASVLFVIKAVACRFGVGCAGAGSAWVSGVHLRSTVTGGDQVVDQSLPGLNATVASPSALSVTSR